MILRPFICGNNSINIPSICGDKPFFTGADDVTITQGTDIDLTEGVVAHDQYGATIPYTVSPTEIEPCQVGVHEVVYTAEDVDKVRLITVDKAADPAISGLTPISVEAGEEFDLATGVTATDSYGNPLEVTFTPAPFSGTDDVTINQGVEIDLTEGVKAMDAEGNVIPFTVSPTTIAKCDVGEHTVTYTSARGTETRTVTIEEVEDPTISGAEESMTETLGVEFDPLEGVSALDGNGNAITVTVELV